MKALIAVLLALAAATPAAAQSAQQNRTDCAAPDANACTRVINDPRESAANKAAAYEHRGISHYRNSDYDRAVADYSEAIRLAPNAANAYRRRGDAYESKRDNDRALADYSEAIRRNPQDYIAHSGRARIYRYARPDLDRAIADYDAVIRLSPNWAHAYRSRGDAHRAKGDYDRAIADFSEAIRLDPKNAVFYLVDRGSAWRAKGDRARAIADYSEAIRLDPSLSPAYRSRGDTYDEAGDHERALADYREVVRLDPKASVYRERGDFWRAKANFDRAFAYYDEAIRHDPKDAEAYASRGEGYRRRGDLDRALADFDAALQLEPKNAVGYLFRGFAYAGKGDHDRAIADFSEVIRLEPTRAAPIHAIRGFAYNRNGDHDLAVADFGEAIRLEINDPGALTGRGLAYEARGEAPRAVVDFRAALAVPPAPGLSGDIGLPPHYLFGDAAHREARAGLDRLGQPHDAAPADVDPPRVAAPQPPPAAPPQATQPQRPAASQAATPRPAAPLGRRVALVIGNGAYTAVPPLANPGRDAAAVAAALRRAGFTEVTVEGDLAKPALERALVDFSARAQGADWALVYYAGHGMAMDGQNYLIPVDARLASDRHVRLEAVALDAVMEAAGGARQLRLVILDACRDNPFAHRIARASSRSVSRGLARIEPAAGELVVYAARDGQVALDGSDGNSPFAAALVEHMEEEGLELDLLFRKVRNSVMHVTSNAQQPFTYGSLPPVALSFRPR